MSISAGPVPGGESSRAAADKPKLHSPSNACGELIRPKGAGFPWFAKRAARATGDPRAFLIAVAVVIVWGATGPLFHYSDTWQLVINTGTTIVTFLMVFLIQNSQNRDTAAIQVKLDELIRAMAGAHNTLINLEDLDDVELDRIQANYRKLAVLARETRRRGRPDTESPHVSLE